MCRHVGRLLAVAMASVLLTACVTGSSPTGAPGSGPASTRLLAGQPMTPCLVQGEVPVKAEVAGLCGTLEVPEDRSNPGGRRIGLRVAVVPALAPVPRPDPAVRDRRWARRREHAVLRVAPRPLCGDPRHP